MFNILDFINDDKEDTAYLLGMAGTGKTEHICNIIKILDSNNIQYKVVAYTHKACNVLLGRIPNCDIITLHKYLTKIPTLNPMAKSLSTLENNVVVGEAEKINLLIVDEYSFIGEKDYCTLRDLQDDKNLKILYVGDPYQLPPVKDVETIVPRGKYYHKLEHNYRVTNNILNTMNKIVLAIDNNTSIDILDLANDDIIIVDSLVTTYKEIDSENKIILTYSNANVELYNSLLNNLGINSKCYISQLNSEYTIDNINIGIDFDLEYRIISSPYKVNRYSKFNPLKYANIFNVHSIQCSNEKESINILGMIGTNTYNKNLQRLKSNLVNTNKQSKQSKHIYRDVKILSDIIVCVDGVECRTIHKSQGSEWDYILLDYSDLTKCIDYTILLRLLYVAISRAKIKIFIKI